MCQKHMMIWKFKRKYEGELKNKQIIEDFSLSIKQCYCTVWNLEKIQKIKIQKLQRQKTKE